MSSYSKISNFILKEDIGEGNFGKVKLAIHRETGEEFAIKILNKQQIKIKMKNTIFKENEIITKFNHINVIFVFAIIDDPDNYYIVMEYCKIGELFDYIVAHQYLSEEESAIFFYQLINGVEYIHSKGIAHRDLKPENLLLTENNILKEDIGEGNFGKVKLAIHRETGEEFAIKILNKKQIKIKMKNTIFKENEIITKFNHINVIFVFAIIDDPDNYYIVMEYCKTGELFDYIVAHQYLSEEDSAIFFYQLINGVEYIHSKGIAHRDLKPENLLLTENNILKIIDFGLSHEFDKINFLSTKCGSPSYAAPEIIKGKKYDGFKTDIWCCGIILYAMVCGYLPFDGENNNILFKNIVECNPEIPNYLSFECQELIMDILKEDPDERITIDGIKKTKFYLKGKALCNINYPQIEKSVIKRRHRIRSYDRGEQNKDNMIKIINTTEKKNNIKN